VQVNALTVQQALETALAKILQRRVRVTASGRTDSGVHALGQVGSFVAETSLSPDQLKRALNGSLPTDIRVRSVEEACPGFHAIRDARKKRYRYVMSDAEQLDVFERRYVWHVWMALDVAAMRDAAGCLVGKHDFASFQAAGSGRASSIRTILDLTLERDPTAHHRIVFEVEADGFLYNMVRNILGSLVLVGRGAKPIGWLAEVLRAKDRKLAGPTAPAHGLTLLRVDY
jgi:tRNA pseudouridine38-40 synthase